LFKVFLLLFLFLSTLFSNQLDSLSKGYLVVAVKYDHKPMSYLNEFGRLSGKEIDLLKDIVDKLNVNIKFVELNNKRVINMLKTNKIDMAIDSSLKSLNEDKTLIHSKAYYFDKQVLLASNTILKNSGFEKKKIGAFKNSAYLSEFKNLSEKNNLVLFSEYFQLKKALKAKNVDGVIIDSNTANSFLKTLDNNFKIIDLNLKTHPYTMVFDSKNILLKNKIDKILENL